MSPRPAQRAPKGRDRDRADRRAVVDVLLARAQRGALTPAEGALLAEHVREEQRLGDESRRAMAGTTQALDRHRAAADDAIRELEQRAERAEHENSILRAVDEGRSHGARRVMNERDQARTALDASRRNVVEAAHEARKQKRHADRYRLAWYAARRDRRAMRAALNAELPLVQAVDRVRVLARTMRAGSPMGAAAIYADRIEQALDNDRRVLDNDTEVRAQFLAAADSTTARLAEQQRGHEIALTHERRISAGWKRRYVGEERRAEQAGRTAAEEFAKLAEAATATAEGRLASIRTMAEVWVRQLPATIRTATAAEAVRRAADGDDTPVMFGVVAEQAAEQQLATVRAALPDEPRPRLGLPNDLAYANGRHDLADSIRQALDPLPTVSTEHQEQRP